MKGQQAIQQKPKPNFSKAINTIQISCTKNQLQSARYLTTPDSGELKEMQFKKNIIKTFTYAKN